MEKTDNLDGEVDFTRKKGNYVLTFGRVGSGKSTLQQHIVSWLHDKSPHVVKLNPVDGSYQSRYELQGWIDKLQRGETLDRTTDIMEFSITVIPENHKKRGSLEFGFFEVSGEDLRKVVPTRENFNPSLPDVINKFLINKKVSFGFLFVSDASLYKRDSAVLGSHQPREDVLFCNFLSYLEVNFKERLLKTPILFVIAKWDEVRDSYVDSEVYMKEHLPQTYNQLKKLSDRGIAIDSVKHSIGMVDVVDGTAIIKDSNFDSTKIILEWIYKAFAKKDINAIEPAYGVFDKIARYL